MQIERHLDPVWGEMLTLTGNGDFNKDQTLVLPLDFGPRILKFLIADQNIFKDFPEHRQDTSDNFKLYGGHRLWSAPEDKVDCYEPDNLRIDCEFSENSVLLRDQKPRKFMREICIKETSTWHIEHRLINNSKDEVKISAWPITMLPVHFSAVLPMPNKTRQGLNPNRNLVLWPYTSLQDSRLSSHADFMSVSPDKSSAFKIGYFNAAGFLAAQSENHYFVKYYPPGSQGTHPDFSANSEVYTDQNVLELESLSSYTSLMPGQSIVHREIWLAAERRSIQRDLLNFARESSKELKMPEGFCWDF